MISVSIAALPSGFSAYLSKSNSAFDASVIFWTAGAGGGGRGAGGGGGGRRRSYDRGGRRAGFGTRSGSHWTIAIDGAQ